MIAEQSENTSNKFYSFDENAVASIDEVSLKRLRLIISSNNNVQVPRTCFEKNDFDLAGRDDQNVQIDYVKWAKKGHALLAVQLSGSQWTDVKLIYLDDKENKWKLTNLGPPIGYFEPEWVKEDKILVAYAGTEDEYGICVFNFEKDLVSYVVPYEEKIYYDNKGIFISDKEGRKKYVDYGDLSSVVDKPEIDPKNYSFLVCKDTGKDHSVLTKVATVMGQKKIYLVGKDLYYYDFLGYIKIPVRDTFQYVSYPLPPIKEKGFSELKAWIGYKYVYCYENGEWKFKGYKIATKEDENLIKKLEKEKMKVNEIPLNAMLKMKTGNIAIQVKDVPKSYTGDAYELNIKIQKEGKSESVKIRHLRPNDDQWWTPLICIEKEANSNAILLAVKYISDSGICTEIYSIPN